MLLPSRLVSDLVLFAAEMLVAVHRGDCDKIEHGNAKSWQSERSHNSMLSALTGALQALSSTPIVEMTLLPLRCHQLSYEKRDTRMHKFSLSIELRATSFKPFLVTCRHCGRHQARPLTANHYRVHSVLTRPCRRPRFHHLHLRRLPLRSRCPRSNPCPREEWSSTPRESSWHTCESTHGPRR